MNRHNNMICDMETLQAAKPEGQKPSTWADPSSVHRRLLRTVSKPKDPQWRDNLQAALEGVVRIHGLAMRMFLLQQKMTAIEDATPVIVPIQTLAPEPYDLLMPIQAVLRPHRDEYIATFFDANLSASGETEEEALANLKDIIVASFEALSGHSQEQLGPAMQRQLAVLEAFVKGPVTHAGNNERSRAEDR